VITTNGLAFAGLLALGNTLGMTASYFITYQLRTWVGRRQLRAHLTEELRRDLDQFGGQDS
jgi:hypothetical protein